MVCCRNCKHFKEERPKMEIKGICWLIKDEPEFIMEDWIIEMGNCDFYEPLGSDNTEE